MKKEGDILRYHQCSVKYITMCIIEERIHFLNIYKHACSKNIESSRIYTYTTTLKCLLDGNERKKINSKRKIVTKVLLTWSKMHYHNGNSCFGWANGSISLCTLSLPQLQQFAFRFRFFWGVCPLSTPLEFPQPFMSTIQPTIIPFPFFISSYTSFFFFFFLL